MFTFKLFGKYFFENNRKRIADTPVNVSFWFSIRIYTREVNSPGNFTMYIEENRQNVFEFNEVKCYLLCV